MIPKIIHYCWLSNDPIPESLQKCMDSWKKYLPDYEIIHWNFDRFDKESSLWVKQAFDNKKYAFAADYIRLYALYYYGGIYLDMDVEVLQSFNEFLKLKAMVCWQKDIGGLEVAAFGAEKGSKWIKACLDHYINRPFIMKNGKFDMKTLPRITEEVLRNNNFKLINITNIQEASRIIDPNCIPVFTCDYFSPKSYKTYKITTTSNSVCIHHFAGTWVEIPRYKILETKFWKLFGLKNLNIIGKIIWRFK